MTRHVRIPDAWPLLLDRVQLAAYLGVSAETVAKICPIRPLDLGAAVVRYNRLAIDDWITTVPQRTLDPKPDERIHDEPTPEPTPDGRRSAAIERVRARVRSQGATRPAGQKA